MAVVMGPLRPDATYGEKLVHDALGRLPDDYQVWPELPVQGDSEREQPDFVLLHPKWGIIVLEAKDRKNIISANPYGLTVRRPDGSEESEPNPTNQAKRHSDTIDDMLENTHRRACAEGSFAGSLPMIPRTYGVVFTRQSRREVSWLEDRLRAKGYLISREDLADKQLEQCLTSLPCPCGVDRLEDRTLELVRRALFPDGDMYREQGRYQGHMTPEQEAEVKAGIFPDPESESELEERTPVEQPELLEETPPSPVRPDMERLALTEEGEQLAQRFAVRLVRGVAGSGKTQILCKRAALLTKLHPDWDILVLTRNRGLAADLDDVLGEYEGIQVFNFDRLCRGQLDAVGLWRSPVDDTDQPGWIRSVADEVPGGSEFDPRLLRDEFNWMKYTKTVTREEYIDEDRDGREIPLSRERERPVVYETFDRYEKKLRRFRQIVWADVPLLMLAAMDEGLIPAEQYDAILVDEAQMFPPTWFEVVKRWVRKPHGMLFLAADMTQNIYGRFSWKRKGVRVRGRTRILRRPYRSTYPIAQCAYDLVRSDEDLQALLKKDGDELIEPDLDHSLMRQGEKPKLVSCSKLQAELDYVARGVNELIADGYWPSEIAVLTLRQEEGQQRFATHLRAQGIPVVLASECRYSSDGPRALVGLISGITGQEFGAVFICDLQDLFRRDSTAFSGSWSEFKAQQKRLLYVAMTRARDTLHMCYRQNLHSTLSCLERSAEAESV
jgi:hypothetical protein